MKRRAGCVRSTTSRIGCRQKRVFATERFRDFVENTLHGQLEIEYFDVAAVAYRGPLK
jgi:hypothetical protein